MKVFVYYNLRKKCWSIKDVKSGLVIAHRTTVLLEDCVCKVSEAGRQRVIAQKRKNVHAGILGYWQDKLGEPIGTHISYNPYLYGYFFNKHTLEPVHSANRIYLDSHRRVWAQ